MTEKRQFKVITIAVMSICIFTFFLAEFSNEANYDYIRNHIFQETIRINLDLRTDVLVFLHIQKTGGLTFGRHLVRDLVINQSKCTCKLRRPKFDVNSCKCITDQKNTWLFSRYSTGWKCGVHPGWSEIHKCINNTMNKIEHKTRNRRYLYITFLRNPISRYISEWKHVRRTGTTWRRLPKCYSGIHMVNITLDEFMACTNSPAINRQTRMLANLSLVNSYASTGQDQQKRDDIMLKSAFQNLEGMAFFGLTEFQMETQLLFEYTFNATFVHPFNRTKTVASETVGELDKSQLQTIQRLNNLDIKLYEMAKRLFKNKLTSMISAL